MGKDNNYNHKLSPQELSRARAEYVAAQALFEMYWKRRHSDKTLEVVTSPDYLAPETRPGQVNISDENSPIRHFNGLVNILGEITRTGKVNPTQRASLMKRNAQGYLIKVSTDGQKNEELTIEALELVAEEPSK